MRQFLDRIAWAVAGISTTMLVLVATGVVDAGTLDPPGPPGPTMKSLEQVEPRTPISSVPYTISQPGSYYLTGNLTGVAGQQGITITAPGVTLDLSGFELRGVPGAANGIQFIVGARGTYIHSGTVRDWPGSGIYATGDGVMISDVNAVSNGQYGILISSGVLENCTATGNSSFGVYAEYSVVRSCTSINNVGSGFWMFASQLHDCAASGNALDGVEAYAGSSIDGCVVSYNTDDGIAVYDGSMVINSVVSRNGNDGIQLEGKASAVGNSAYNNGRLTNASGILARGSGNRIEGNHASAGFDQKVGLGTLDAGNVFINNTSQGHPFANYNIVSSAATSGPIATPNTATNPFTNISVP